MNRKATAFLARHGWDRAEQTSMAGDASTKHYHRLRHKQGQTALLMEWPKGAPISGMENYSRRAMLAQAMPPFLAMTHWLRTLGLSAPKVLAAEPELGLALVEDLGDAAYGSLLETGDEALADELYRAALDGLLVIARQPAPETIEYPGGVYAPQHFSLDVFLTEASLFADAYLELQGKTGETFIALWTELYHQLAQTKPVLLLRDYHSPNLLWLPQREGAAQAGLIDYQDALIGTPLYDVVSLLQDARLFVPPERAKQWLSHYAKKRREQSAFLDDEAIARDMAILGTQRLLKIFGIFRFLQQKHGKETYMRHMPRLKTYLAANLSHPVLQPFAAWLAETAPELARNP